VTIISVGAVFVTATLMFVFVPLGRRLIGEGGECAGAAAAVISSEACVLIAMLSSFRRFPLDAPTIRALVKMIGLGLAILFADRQLRGLGPARLVVDAVAYAGFALAIGVVRIKDIGAALHLLHSKV
jgi:hypothetical protein